MLKPDFHVFGGYVWYAYPKGASSLDPPGGADAKARFRVKDFVTADAYSNYHDDGLLIITATAKKPEASNLWQVVPLRVPDGFGGKVNENTVIRHIYTLVEKPEEVFSFFIGLRVPVEI